MESAIAWALEDKLGYWIKSFSREQLSLRGRTARLSNVEIDGDALHAGLGLPPALAVATARIQELVITLPSILNMQVEPTVVNIDKLEIILEEKDEMEHHSSPNSDLPLTSSTKDSGPGYADKARAEGLQAIRPHLRNPVTGNGTAQGHQAGSAIDSSDQGTDVEATMVTSQDNNGVSKWTPDKSRFSIEDLVIGAVAAKEEQEYLITLCRSEADSLGRIAAAVLCLLELDGSLGQASAAIDQLGSLGSGLDGIFTPEKFSTK